MSASRLTLRTRLILASLAGLIAATGVFAFASTSLVRSLSERNARDDFDQEAVRVARLASAQIERRAREGTGCRQYGPEEFEAFVGPGARMYASGLQLCPGTDVALFPRAPARLTRAIDRGLIARQGFARIDPAAIPGNRPSVATAAPITVNGTSLADLIVVKPRDEVRSEVADVAPRLAAAALIGLVPAVLLTLLMTTRLTRPIRDLRRATDRVAAGDLSAEVRRTGTADLDALADDFNIMVARLRQRDDQSRDFLMKVTHDLRTPLTAIRGHTAALIDGIVPEHMRDASLQAVDGEAQRLERMVADLLDLARMEARRFSLSVVPADPSEIVERIVAAHAARARETGVELGCDIDNGPPVRTDPGRMEQIVANLVDNALRWTPAGGSVTVSSRALPTGGVEVDVSDSGPGVPPSQREEVFAPFTSHETPDGRTGTGLGLAICRQLARALGGDVAVGDAERGGARFVLTLPRAAPEQPEGPEPPAEA